MMTNVSKNMLSIWCPFECLEISSLDFQEPCMCITVCLTNLVHFVLYSPYKSEQDFLAIQYVS